MRDTFIKYYRIEQDKSRDESKKRRWHFYNDLKFLQPHVELFRLDGSFKTEETIPIYLKEDFIEVHHDEGEKHFYFEEDSPEGDAIRYQIKIDQEDEEPEQNEEQLLENFEEDHNEQNLDDTNKSEQSAEYVIVEAQQEEQISQSKSDQNEKIDKDSIEESSQRPITDPDERYLLSCLPAFKRLTPQQKALLRIGIEKLFYEVEFESEPLMKRFKTN